MENLDARMLVDLLRDRISPDRNLGQHFILDEKVISEAVSMCNDIDREVTRDSHKLRNWPRTRFTYSRTSQNRCKGNCP